MLTGARPYNRDMIRRDLAPIALAAALACSTAAAGAQTPVPFPKPGVPSKPGTQPPTGTVTPPRAATAGDPAQAAPTEATLGLPIYPTAEFIRSFDAGRGQRYYLFGTNATFVEIVAYYRSILKQRGELVYDEPPVHMFDVGRFREETMAFPPGVTVKDYTWGGSQGYLVPASDGASKRFRTVIQLVPPPAGAGR